MSNSSEVKEIFGSINGSLEKTLIYHTGVYKERYPNKGTLDVKFSTDIRSVLAKRFGYNSPEHKLAKKIAALDDKDKAELVKTQNAKVYNNLTKRVVIKKTDVQRIVNECIESDDVYLNSIALLISSGARQYELLKLSNFEKVDNKIIRQTKIAKSKTDLILIKPLIIMNTDTFMTLLNKVRASIIFNKNSCNKLNKIFKELFDQSLHFSRKIYGSYSYQIYGGDDMSLSVWLNKTLGHNPESLSSSNNYSNVLIK